MKKLSLNKETLNVIEAATVAAGVAPRRMVVDPSEPMSLRAGGGICYISDCNPCATDLGL